MQPGSILLETARPDRENSQTLFFTEPRTIITAFEPGEVRDALAELDKWVDRGYYGAGFLEYEAGYAFEEIAPLPRCNDPICWFGIYDSPTATQPNWFETGPDPGRDLKPRFSISKSEYAAQIRAIKEHLLEGNVYQINLTGTFEFEFSGEVFELYRRLRQRQPVGYNAYLVTDHQTILSFSPELFFRRKGNDIWTRPMKGTVRRGSRPEEDVVLSNWLRSDPKTRAENLMIVDLLRNDLSRISVFGSVEVSDMFDTELHDTVIQLTSTVSGELKPSTTYADIFAALFPCGSITGAPKVRAMQIIRDVEQRRRGIYTGTIGYVSPEKQAVFSVAIRTISLSGSVGKMGSGGGIVWDSSAESEYAECLLKASFLTGQQVQPSLFETIVWQDGYQRLEKHMSRLGSSAVELNYPVDLDEIHRQLATLEQTFSADPQRVRVLVHADGETAISHRPLNGPSIKPGTVRVSAVRSDPDDFWLYHKSTRRDVYDAEYAAAVSDGHAEVIFINTRGEVTEGSRSNLFIRRGGRLLTPPVTSGLLPGTRRAHVLEELPSAVEITLHLSDLLEADEILLCNATTPLTPVVLWQPVNHNLE